MEAFKFGQQEKSHCTYKIAGYKIVMILHVVHFINTTQRQLIKTVKVHVILFIHN